MGFVLACRVRESFCRALYLSVMQMYLINLKSFDLSSGPGCPPLLISHSPLCFATQIIVCYWSEESFLSLIVFTSKTRNKRDIRAQVRHSCSVFKQYKSWPEPQVKLRKLRSISIKIRPLFSIFKSRILPHLLRDRHLCLRGN
jgi:hypothetical protein